MRVLITGANGMLATNIIEELLGKGYQVRGLLRRLASYKGVSRPNLELIAGDFTDYETVLSALADCDYVIHAAADTAQNHLNYEEYRRVNVEATEQLLKLSLISHIKRFLYVSSANTVGCGTAERPGDEHSPLFPPLSRSMYARSKAEAETAVLGYSAMMDVVVANPSFMVGRYGSVKGSNRILKMARRITFCPSGGKSFVDVEQAARGVIAVLEWGTNGNRYLISGENLSFREFFALFPQVRHVVVIPRAVMLLFGFVGSALRSVGIRLSLSITNAQLICTPCAYTSAKAQSELGFKPTPISRFIHSKNKKI